MALGSLVLSSILIPSFVFIFVSLGYKLKLYRDNVDSILSGIKDRLSNTAPVNATTQDSTHNYDMLNNVVEELPREQFIQKKLEVLEQGVENLKTILTLTPPVVVQKLDVSTIT